MPIKRSAVERLAVEQRDKTHAVNPLFLRRAQSGHLQDRRQEVDARHRLVLDAPGAASPAHDHRLPDAALVHPALAAAQRQIRRRRSLRSAQTAVVRHEEGDRVLCEAVLLERAQDASHGLIHRFHHPCVDGVVLLLPRQTESVHDPARASEPNRARLRLVLGDQVLARH